MTTVLVAHPGAEMFGSDRMLLESVIGFVDAGARVVVALPSRGPLDRELRAAGAEGVVIPMLVLRKALLKPRGWPTLIRDTLRGLGAAWRLIGRLRPDVVYVSTITIPQWPLLARMRGVRAITHVHEAEGSGGRLVSAALYLPHLAARGVIANSHYTLQTMRQVLPALTRHATVVHNGVFSPDDPLPPRDAPEGPLRVLYVGRLSPRKGTDLVIEAASLLHARGHGVRVTLLGAVFEGYEWYEQQLREQAAEAGIPVEFVGFHADIWPFLAASDVLVVPSRGDESFGNTVAEGVLALRPVIVSAGSGLTEAATGFTTTRLISKDQAAPIAGALEDILEHWDDVVGTVAEARAEARRRHAPEAYRAAVTKAVMPLKTTFRQHPID